MNAYNPDFIIAVQSESDLDGLLALLRQEWEDFEQMPFGVFKISGNWLEVEENHLYDPEMVSDPSQGYIYFRYRIMVRSEDVRQPASEGSAELTERIAFAEQLKSRLEKMGCSARILADFDGLLKK
jgi:hypothetical protein